MDKPEIIILIIVTATVFTVILSGFIVILVRLYAKARKNFLLEKENINRQFQTQLLHSQMETQEQTLQNVSQEIHDNIGQALTFVKLNINTIDPHKIEQTQEKLLESKQLLSQTIQDLRSLSKTLHTGMINEAGLPGALEYQLSFLQKTGVYNTELQVTGEVFKNKPFVETALFRVLQELLNNIIKHAEATLIRITLQYDTDLLRVEVADNGKGFSEPAAGAPAPVKGLGMKTTRERLQMINGRLAINSNPGTGTTAIIEIPRQS